MQPKTIKSKDNGCGTAPGNLVINIISNEVPKMSIFSYSFLNSLCGHLQLWGDLVENRLILNAES